MVDKFRKRENLVAGIISMIILIGGTLFFVLVLIGAIVYFSWFSILIIPFCILGLLSITWIYFLAFSKDMQKQCKKTWKQAHDVE
jgi:membrane protein implicated in regulation of membrane protease activity